jgi:CYTH domain-containing protein
MNNIEIEHKFLVKNDSWKSIGHHSKYEITQAYISTNPNRTVRLRIGNESGFITIKGKKTNGACSEYEYDIPLSDAKEMMESDLCNSVLKKVRYVIKYEGKYWEIDVFGGLNEGLVIAELELKSEDEKYILPPWVGEDITSDGRYSNASLSINPMIKLQL